jgi:MFS family permease
MSPGPPGGDEAGAPARPALRTRTPASDAVCGPHPAPPTSPWPLVVLLYLSGLLAAAQLGKLSALAPHIAPALGLALPVIAVAISLIELGGATCGAIAGLLAQRLGLRRCLRGGVALLAAGGLGSALVDGLPGLYGWRLVEAAGYLGVIVSAPVLIAERLRLAGARAQGLALTLWSTFVPVGLALGAWGSAAAAALVGWRGASVAWGMVALALTAALARAALPEEHGRAAASLDPEAAPAGPSVWPLALAFGLFALFEVGVLGLLPSFLVAHGLSTAAAGGWTAVASVSAVAGSAVTALLLRRGTDPRGAMAASIGLPPLMLWAAFRAEPDLPSALAWVIGLNMLGGVFASLAFALLPRLAGSPSRMVRANGLIAQCGASGSLLGPPAMAACVEWGGWPAAALFGAVVSAAALPLAWHAASTRRSAASPA